PGRLFHQVPQVYPIVTGAGQSPTIGGVGQGVRLHFVDGQGRSLSRLLPGQVPLLDGPFFKGQRQSVPIRSESDPPHSPVHLPPVDRVAVDAFEQLDRAFHSLPDEEGLPILRQGGGNLVSTQVTHDFVAERHRA